MNQFFTWNYYFHFRPHPNFQFSKLTFGIALALIIAGLIFSYYRKNVMKDKIARKLLRPYGGKLMTYGFLALCLLAFREAGLPYLSMRIWWVVWLGFFLYTFLKLAFTYQKQYKQRAKKKVQVTKKKDYLPKKKKH